MAKRILFDEDEVSYKDGFYRLETKNEKLESKVFYLQTAIIVLGIIAIIVVPIAFTTFFTSERLGNAVCLEQANATYDTYGIMSGILYCNPSTNVQKYDGLYLVVRDKSNGSERRTN